MSTKRSILFVCLGNICRSPLGEGLFRAHIESLGEAALYEIDSAGTSSYHKGERPDPGSVRVAREHGLDISDQRSRSVDPKADARFDLVVAMDRRNLSWLQQNMDLPEERLVLLRKFDEEEPEPDVPDPYGDGPDGFLHVHQIIERSVPGLKQWLDALDVGR